MTSDEAMQTLQSSLREIVAENGFSQGVRMAYNILENILTTHGHFPDRYETGGNAANAKEPPTQSQEPSPLEFGGIGLSSSSSTVMTGAPPSFASLHRELDKKENALVMVEDQIQKIFAEVQEGKHRIRDLKIQQTEIDAAIALASAKVKERQEALDLTRTIHEKLQMDLSDQSMALFGTDYETSSASSSVEEAREKGRQGIEWAMQSASGREMQLLGDIKDLMMLQQRLRQRLRHFKGTAAAATSSQEGTSSIATFL
eukprot:PhF_6_TR32426/c0_g1_i4/m.48124